MRVRNIHKITKIKRDNGKMSFNVLWKKYEEDIDYSLILGEQISKILWKEVFFCLETDNLYVTN